MIVKYVKLPLYFLLGITLFFLVFQPQTNAQSEFVSVQANVLNVRSGPGTSHEIVDKVKEGTILSVVEKFDRWYHVQLTNGRTGWVAKQYVDSLPDIPPSPITQPYIAFASASKLQDLYGISLATLQDKTIVIDAGHGGRDKGAVGTSGTYEKDLTLITSKLLQKRLSTLGAHVVMTRTNDQYISLEQRVALANKKKADAFISIHYNSSKDDKLHGIITYYDRHQSLAESIHKELISLTTFDNKEVRHGDYHVLRENSQPSVLLELGFLSNAHEETQMQTGQFQYNVVTAIVKGLARYFDEQNT
ncbi:N-acetylmuramoyl-L-alanine amidase [Bacillus songklensis]|uniref:N-acetylmuramoyl-L-alanine amidase n=1 Tax=Bacillus songklensis TaxID=1069116 RepID=A0ABV8AYL0_9BACI